MSGAVEPIREDEWIAAFANHLKEKNERDFVMFMVGIHTGLRISDILPIRVRDVEDTHLVVLEKKTKKQRRIVMHRDLRRLLKEYIKDMERTELLFPSQRKSPTGRTVPIGRWRAWEILKDAQKAVGYDGRIGTHTMRKTFGFRYYQQYKDVAELQEIFNHTSQSETLRYIGVMSERVERKVAGMKSIEGL